MSNNTIVRGLLVPSLKNKPLDGRQEVPTLADIANIENPYVNFIFPVEETGKWYKVLSLTDKVIDELVIPDGMIDEYEPFGEGMTDEQKEEYLTKSLAEQTYLKKEDAVEEYLNKTEAKADYLKKEDAANEYLNKENAEADFLKKKDAEETYLNKTDAEGTFLKKEDAEGTYLNKTEAEETYQQKGDYATNKDLNDLRNEVNKKDGAVEVVIGETEPSLNEVKLWVDTSVTSDDTGGEGGGDVAPEKKHEVLSISLVNDVNETFTAKVDINGNVIEISSNSSYSTEIAYGTTYTIKPLEIYLYSSSDNFTFTAEQPLRNVVINYNKAKITETRIDQTSKDASTAVTRITDNGGVEAIRANSHRYVGTYSDGVMSLKQLNDNDGTLYNDGTDASEDIKSNDVFMKLPKFYYKCRQSDDLASYIYINFAYGACPDETYKEWDGKDLIGVYQTGTSKSVSGTGVSGKQSVPEIDSWLGFLQWKHLCMIHWLSVVYYKTTQYTLLFGHYSGSTSSGFLSGLTDHYGMNDTKEDYVTSPIATNMWGLEGWTCSSAGTGGTYIDGVVLTSSGITITENDGIERGFVFSSELTSTANGYVAKYYPGENLDVFYDPNEKASSDDLLYLDSFSIYITGGTNLIHNLAGRSDKVKGCAVSNIAALVTFRIVYCGEWVEI